MYSKIKCLIVDDEPLAISVIKEYLEKVPQLELVHTCEDALQAFQLLRQESIDLIFLDIEMPNLNGIDFVKSLSNPPAVILTTAYREYALESYEVEVVDYLLKPISFSRFFKAINKYLKLSNATTPPTPVEVQKKVKGSIYVYSDKRNIKVFLDDILYIESLKDYVRIHTSEQRILSKDTISRYESLLPDAFLRVHRSFIVNTTKISAYTQHDIEIGVHEIPIGTSYKKQVKEYLR
ncbi:MAG: LytTR family DNA-binding domain-containing protein [Bacteroidota bacterium]